MCDSIANGQQRGGGSFTQPLANLVVSNSVTATNVFATTYFGDGGLLSNITTGLVQPLANLVVSNTVTTNNAAVGNTLTVSGSMTANVANATFFFDTFTIPYINTQVLNVASMIGITNVTTLNVQSLFANSATIYGANTLNVLGISNLSSVVTPMANVGTLNVATISNLNSLQTPLANVGTLNVATISNLNSLTLGSLNVSTISNLNSLQTPLANVGTLNVATISNLNSLALTTANVGTLNVQQVSNLTTLSVANNIFATNAVTATTHYGNVSASNVVVTPATGVTGINVTGNIYASNAVTTTNIVAAGFTSNSTNTVFNYTTLSVPYINCTSVNVTGTATYSTLNAVNSLATGSIGFATIAGTGGTVTQLTSRNTGVTLDKPCGTITLFSSAILSQASNTFTLTNSYIASTDFVLVNHVQTQTPGAYTIATNPNAGSVDITMRNVSGGTLTAGAPVLQFVVIKSTNA